MNYVISKNICNLSRIPMDMKENPIYKTSLQILKNPNIDYKDTDIYKFNFCPKTLGDVFGIEELKNYSYTACFLPWLHKKPQSQLVDNAFIKFNKKEKFNKIKSLLNSILKYSYIPEKFPDRKKCIRGYNLYYKGRKKTYIVSGNHRAAILSSLNTEVPYLFEESKYFKSREIIGLGIDYKNFPGAFSDSNVFEWPSVKSGFLTPDIALKIMSKYFEF